MTDLDIRPAVGAEPPAEPAPGVVVDLVVPVYDEAHVLEASIRRLHAHLGAALPFPWRITIADNGSDDGTVDVARRLAEELAEVEVLALARKGRGRALRAAWSRSDALVVAYTDVDLSTDLAALLPLVAPLVSGHSDVAIGSRLARGARVVRGPRREVVSRAYNYLLRTAFAVRFTDAQCGFKAVRADAVDVLLPEIRDEGWFFDTELLLLAEHNGLRVHEVPVDWVDDPDSRVDVVGTALDDLRGMARMGRTFLAGGGAVPTPARRRAGGEVDAGRQLAAFALIGTTSTAVSLATYVRLRRRTGPVMANTVAVSATAVANTWANHRWTFPGRSGRARTRDQRRGLALVVGGMAVTDLGLAAVARRGGGRRAELVTVALAWSATAVARFAVLRRSAGRDGEAS